MSHRPEPPIFALAAALLAAALTPLTARAVVPMRDGSLPAEVRAAAASGLLASPLRPALGTTAVQGHPVWVVPVLLVDFTDQPLSSASTPAVWERALFDTTHSTPTGSAYDYYRWVSRGQFWLLGKVVAVVHLTHDKHYYANGAYGLATMATPNNDYGLVNEAINLCDGKVDFSPYDQDHDGYVDMLWVIHSGIGGEATVDKDNLYSVTSSMDQWNNGNVFVTNDTIPNGGGLKMRINRFSILPELSQFHAGQLSEIGVYCHEFGHALGLPDLYDTSGGRNFGPGNFSLMSTGAYGGDGQSPESPVHMGAWPCLYLGWVPAVTPAFDTTLTIAAIEDGGPIVNLWFQGESSYEHFLIEHRRRTGFDQHLPGDGMILYHVDDLLMGYRMPINRVNGGDPPALRLVEADGFSDLVTGTSRGDAADMFPGTSGRTRIDDDTTPSLVSNSGAPTSLVVDGIHLVGAQLGLTAHVRAPGWLTPIPLPITGATPGSSSGPGPRSALLGDGSIVLVTSETPAGSKPQVRLRTQWKDGAWLPTETVSHSTGSAVDPALAPIPGGGLALVWSDSRDGVNQLWYRTKLRGNWSPETRITALPGSSRNPSIAVDPHGYVHIAWLYTENSIPQVRYKRFWFLLPGDSASAGDTTLAITGPTDRPDAPGIGVDPRGSAIVTWPERSSSPIKLWFVHVSADSGVGGRNRLGPNDQTFQQVFSSRLDDQGTLHTVWIVPNLSSTEIHYQRREAYTSFPSIRDTVLDSRPQSMQNLCLALDPGRGLHLSYELSNGGIPQVMYKRYRTDRGWDLGSTEVTRSADGIASRPQVVPRESGRVSVMFLTFPGGVPTWSERRREARRLLAPTGVPASPPVAVSRLALAPDPVRAGGAVRVAWAGTAPAGGVRVRFYDVSGRHVGDTELARSGPAWVGTLDAGRTREWGAGVYFARVEGTREAARLVVLR